MVESSHSASGALARRVSVWRPGGGRSVGVSWDGPEPRKRSAGVWGCGGAWDGERHQGGENWGGDQHRGGAGRGW